MKTIFSKLLQAFTRSAAQVFSALIRLSGLKNENGAVKFMAINNADKTKLCDIIGYENQKQKLRENTEAFVNGKSANNVLLYGDSGTGKSTSVKALINEYYDKRP